MKLAAVAVMECLDHGMYNYMALYCWTFNRAANKSIIRGHNERNLTKNNQTTSKDSPKAIHKQNSNNFDDNDIIEKSIYLRFIFFFNVCSQTSFAKPR